MQKKENITLIYHARETRDEGQLDAFKSQFGQVILLDDNIRTAPEAVHVVEISKEKGKVEALNRAIGAVSGTHILWLNEGETIAQLPSIKKNTCYIAKLRNPRLVPEISNKQIRIVPNFDARKMPIPGFTIPDLYAVAKEKDWELDEESCLIQSETFISPKEIESEVAKGKIAPLQLFWEAMHAAEQEDFKHAKQCYENLLKTCGYQLAPWNHLAAINGLANVLMELHRLEEACEHAARSLELASSQRAPHLIRYQYYSFKKEQAAAYKALKYYHANCSTQSAANWDVALPKEQGYFLMADIAFRLGWHEEAYQHYEQFLEACDGDVNRPILEKLMIYAVELNQRGKAISYFNRLFGTKWSAYFDEAKSIRMREALSLFSDNGWYDFSSRVYRQLVEDRPHDETLRNGYIKTLIKNDELEKAQALL